MNDPRARLRLVFHGAVVLLAGLLCGYPTVVESLGGEESVRLWHTAHEALIMMGVWILAMSAVLPTLVLPRREAAGLVWRSEEHTSELQSRRDLVCRLLLEKKKLCKSD